MSNAIYTIEIYALDLNANTIKKIDVINTFHQLSYYNKLNGIGAASITLNIDDPKANATNLVRFKNQVVIKRNGTIVFVGPIVKRTADMIGVAGSVTIQCQSYMYHLTTRYTDQASASTAQFTSHDQADMAWQLINYTQGLTNGNLFISKGGTPTSTARNRTFDRTKVADGLVEISGYNGGLDYSFDPSIDSNGNWNGVIFNTYYPQLGNVRNDLPPLRFPDNIDQLKYADQKEVFNYGLAIGAGSGTNVALSTSQQTSSQIAYTRREIINTLKDTSDTGVLSSNITQSIIDLNVDRFSIEVIMKAGFRPTVDQYILGDYLNTNIHKGFINYDGTARVTTVNIDVNDNGYEKVSPVLLIYT